MPVRPCALVTGSTSGIGQAIATAFAGAGHDVVLNGFGDPGAIESLRARLERDHGVTVRHIGADMSRPGEIEAMMRSALAAFGAVDVLVNNAGILPFRFVEDTDDALLDDVMTVNFGTVFRLCRQVYPAMRARRAGAIVNVASELSFVGLPGYAAYCASKGAVLAFTRALALEAAPHGVRVNALCPGPTDTAMMANEIASAPSPEKARAEMLASVPAGRLGRPEEIAQVALFLASDAASFVQGAAFLADGGRTAI